MTSFKQKAAELSACFCSSKAPSKKECRRPNPGLFVNKGCLPICQVSYVVAAGYGRLAVFDGSEVVKVEAFIVELFGGALISPLRDKIVQYLVISPEDTVDGKHIFIRFPIFSVSVGRAAGVVTESFVGPPKYGFAALLTSSIVFSLHF